ncbi:ABC transporter permease [Actinopolymorpha alba]|uniref:ABC transporter permease n=1 Tax=Actinopolymorpha alba TaxID=533267 RepID=UPI00036E4469|nr:ABC transporter permease [Actinopolymorpha alba]
MSTVSHTFSDSATMLRRNLLHMVRYPSMTLLLFGMPIIFLLLFVYVFGGTLGAGLGGASGGRAEYLRYVIPGILMMTLAAVSQGTAVSIAMDMTEGIIARFRTMAISRASVMTGHVLGSILQALIGLTLVIGIAVLLGFRPNAGLTDWLALIGVLALISLALTWLTVAMGMASKTVESASNVPMPLTLLPFLGSGFVPTDSMPAGLRWFAEYQPFTPFIETIRGLLVGTPIGSSGWQTVAWSLGIALLGYVWARRLYDRDPSR